MRHTLKSVLVFNNSPLIFFLLLLFSSCEYKPNDVYEREVIQNPTAPNIETVELYLNEDTVFFYTTKMTINFNFKSSNQAIIYIKISVDGSEKGLVKSSSGQFKFENISLPSGIHSLKIDLYTHSGSSSIADKLEMEGYLFSKTWVLISENIWDMKYRVETLNGFLKISIPIYRNADLKEYIITRELNAFTHEIARVRSNEFTDSAYIGEGGKYMVSINTMSGSIINWGEVTITKDLPVLNFFTTHDNNYSLKWSKSKYYNALKGYYIVQSNLTSGLETRKTLTNSADTVLSLPDTRFNDILYIYLRSIPREANPFYNSSFYYQYENEISLRAGIPFKIAYSEGKAFPINKDEFVYAEWDTIYRCSVSQNKILESRGYSINGCYRNLFTNLKVSPNGENLVAYVGCNKDIFRSSAFNFQNFSLANLNTLTSNFNPQIAVSDVGIGIVPSLGYRLYLYDFVNSQILGTIPVYASVYSNREISSDGKYFFIPADSLRYYKFDTGQFKLIWKSFLTSKPVFYSFNSLHPDKMVLWVNSVFYVKQCNDFSTINEFPLSATKIFNVDFYTNQVLAYAPGHLYVISIIDGALLYDVPINFTLSPYADECFLLNNTIISRKSVSYNLN